MPTLNINGQRVKVDDSFLSLSREDQDRTVDEIAASLSGGAAAAAPNAAPADAPPAGARPGSKAYADWAMSRVKAGLPIPKVTDRPLDFGADTSVVGDINAGYTAALDAVPILGPKLKEGVMAAKGALYGVSPDQIAAEAAANERANPEAAMVGSVAGTVVPLLAAGGTTIGGRLLGTTGSLLGRTLAGSGSSAVLSGLDTAVRGGNAGDVARNMAIGGTIGAVVPFVGDKVGGMVQSAIRNRAVDKAIANAPAATDLKSVASGLFKQVDQAGVMVAPRALAVEVSNLLKQVKQMRINPKLDPKAMASYEELIAATQEALAGKPLTFGDLHNLRQIAQKAATSSEGRDAMFADKIVDMLDNFITKPKAAMTPNGPVTGNQLLEAISTWGRARRVGLVEQAIERAKNTASGFENGIRIEFRKLLNNKKTASLFTQTEREEIERVVRGTTGANLMKLIGKFGFGSGNASNMLGGTIGTSVGASVGGALGPLGSLAGAALAGGGATLARKGAEKITTKAAERAAKVVATPNIAIPAPVQLPFNPLAPAVLPLGVTRDQRLIGR